MEFAEPAPLTVPNLAGYTPGTEIDLWSMNPITGAFDNDGDGNRTAFVDENGNRTSYEYDLMNRLVFTIEPDPDGTRSLEAPVY